MFVHPTCHLFLLCFNLDPAKVAESFLFFASNYINQFFTQAVGWAHKAQLSIIIEEGLGLISLVGQRRLMIIHACLDKEGSVHVCKSGSIETIRISLCFSFCCSVYNWSKILFINSIRDVSDTFVYHLKRMRLHRKLVKYMFQNLSMWGSFVQCNRKDTSRELSQIFVSGIGSAHSESEEKPSFSA